MSTVAVAVIAGAAGLVLGAAAILVGLRLRGRGVGGGRVGTTGPPRLAAEVVAALHIGAVVVDRRDQVVLANPVAATMGLVRGDDLALNDLRSLARDARETGHARQCEVALLHRWWPRDSAVVYARALLAGTTGHVVFLVEDVTEARRVADMRRDFIANVSHELKTPVGAMALLAEALGEAGDDPEAIGRFAGRMRHEATRLARLVSELIELSRLEAAEPPAQLELVELRLIVNEAVDRTRLAAGARSMQVDVDTVADVSVRADRQQLITALVNLLDNAVAYSPEDTRVVVAARERVADGRRCVDVAVTDQGIGVDDADLDRIFERFYRADPARSRATGGTGLGLAIVKHIAANHGGAVAVRTRPGRGSTFTLTLPVADAAAEAARGPAAVGGSSR